LEQTRGQESGPARPDDGQILGDRGAPATEDELTRVFDRLGVPAASRAALVDLRRKVEGAPS